MCRYVLITPLVNEQWGSGVLVNRGWVPASWKTDSHLQASGLPTGKVNFRIACTQRLLC